MAKQTQDAHRRSHAQDTCATYLSLITESLTPNLVEGNALTTLGQKPCTPSAVDAVFDKLIDRLLPTLAAHLKTLEGLNLGVEANHELVKSLNALLKRTGCQLMCPHCQQPAYALRYRFAGTSTTPVFQYAHRPGVTHGGRSALNTLTLIREPLE